MNGGWREWNYERGVYRDREGLYVLVLFLHTHTLNGRCRKVFGDTHKQNSNNTPTHIHYPSAATRIVWMVVNRKHCICVVLCVTQRTVKQNNNEWNKTRRKCGHTIRNTTTTTEHDQLNGSRKLNCYSRFSQCFASLLLLSFSVFCLRWWGEMKTVWTGNELEYSGGLDCCK